MQYRKLGNTPQNVSVVSFGCWALSGGFNWGEQDENDSIAATRAAYEAGINLFDTAEGYESGASEKILGKALESVRDHVLYATKVSPNHFSGKAMREACERSLENLRTDRIDLYQLHWPNHEMPVDEVIEGLEALKKEGKILAYGLSNFGKQDLTEALAASDAIASNQVSYSLLFRAVEDEVLPLCRDRNVSVLCYSPLMQGLLTGKFPSADEVPEDRARTRHFKASRPAARHGQEGHEQETFETIERVRAIADDLGKPMAEVSLAWLLAQPGVTSVIAGGRNADQVRRNVRAVDLELTPDTILRLAEATQPLKEKLGPDGDMWMVPSRMR